MHSPTDSLSRRPCVNENCAHCDRYEEKYLSFDLHPGVATRNIGVQKNLGESEMKVVYREEF